MLIQTEQYVDTFMPGFTHLQTAQPVMFGRDLSRMRDAFERMNESPLGADALARTGFPIDCFMTAQATGVS
ncbi:hypothetical protein ME3_00246 [Bartonella melophagi K-2C]|uniref:Fumarate lyase N-terminal domain-containing protein n=1 Tax=Bartonella melophagi K-2C TaxID=1094557 RepID=J0ZTA4_9HYPH|nr:hypothetical protein ME3_00246 [Bartonella melophagi K-2C]